MNSLPYSLLLFSALTISACSPVSPEQALNERIESSIRLIESGQYERLLVNYYQPHLVEDLKSNHNIQKLATYYGEAPQTDFLLKDLKLALQSSPEFNTSKTLATFSNEKLGLKMVWKQVDNVWYLTK